MTDAVVEITTNILPFIRERDAMLLSLDIECAKAFHRKHNPEVPLPPDDVIEVGLHKARVGAGSLPQEARDFSRRWLTKRGYLPHIRPG